MTGEEIEAWRTHLADYEVKPLFDQLSAVLPEVGEGADHVDDVDGRETTGLALRRAATKRGFRRGENTDGPWYTEYTKEFRSLGLRAVVDFSGVEFGAEDAECFMGSLVFCRSGRYRPVPLDKVPAALLAECYADYLSLVPKTRRTRSARGARGGGASVR